VVNRRDAKIKGRGAVFAKPAVDLASAGAITLQTAWQNLQPPRPRHCARADALDAGQDSTPAPPRRRAARARPASCRYG